MPPPNIFKELVRKRSFAPPPNIESLICPPPQTSKLLCGSCYLTCISNSLSTGYLHQWRELLFSFSNVCKHIHTPHNLSCGHLVIKPEWHTCHSCNSISKLFATPFCPHSWLNNVLSHIFLMEMSVKTIEFSP